MAQRVSVDLVDDIDGGSAVETLRFALDGVDYEIDLGKRNADRPARGDGRLYRRRTPFGQDDRTRPRPHRGAAPGRGRRRSPRRPRLGEGQSGRVPDRGRIPLAVLERTGPRVTDASNPAARPSTNCPVRIAWKS